MRLVENWKQAWRWFSMWAFAICASIPVAWVSLPEDVKKLLPDSWEKWVFVAIAAAAGLGAVGRVIDQTKGKGKAP